MARTDGADGLDPAALEEAVFRTAEAGRFSGTVRVTRGGEPLLTREFGAASRRWSVPNTPDTRFHVASVAEASTTPSSVPDPRPGGPGSTFCSPERVLL